MIIRRLESSDANAVVAIQSACPEIAQWSAQDYLRVAGGEMAGWIAADTSKVAGFLVARHAARDLEILNFAVRLEIRRHAIGSLLLSEALAWGKAVGAENAFLEVRASNLAALSFYERHSFYATGRRIRYYAAPIEDALVLAARL